MDRAVVAVEQIVVLEASRLNQLGAEMPRLYTHLWELTTNSRLLGSQVYLRALAAARLEDVEVVLSSTEQLVKDMPREPEAHLLRTYALFSDAWAQGVPYYAQEGYQLPYSLSSPS